MTLLPRSVRLLLGVACAMLWLASPAEVQAAPYGSYARSCRACSYIGNQMCCSCRTRRGFFRRSCVYMGCRRAIRNCNGRLTCGSFCNVCPVPRLVRCAPGFFRATTSYRWRGRTCFRYYCKRRALPPGSYMTSCRGCYVLNGRLSCRCRTRRGFYRRTSTSLYCRRSISNCNGNLVCGGCGVVCPVPRVARCGPNYRLRRSTYWYRGRLCTNYICRYVGGQLMRGSYKFSCRSCRVRMGRMCCHCRNARGYWRYSCTSLYCSRRVRNCNGHLVCGRC